MKVDEFPYYRKYTGIDVWFKIVNAKHFIEIKKLGAKYIKHEVFAEQFPEIMYIQDMINLQGGRWEEANGKLIEELISHVP